MVQPTSEKFFRNKAEYDVGKRKYKTLFDNSGKSSSKDVGSNELNNLKIKIGNYEKTFVEILKQLEGESLSAVDKECIENRLWEKIKEEKDLAPGSRLFQGEKIGTLYNVLNDKPIKSIHLTQNDMKAIESMALNIWKKDNPQKNEPGEAFIQEEIKHQILNKILENINTNPHLQKKLSDLTDESNLLSKYDTDLAHADEKTKNQKLNRELSKIYIEQKNILDKAILASKAVKKLLGLYNNGATDKEIESAEKDYQNALKPFTAKSITEQLNTLNQQIKQSENVAQVNLTQTTRKLSDLSIAQKQPNQNQCPIGKIATIVEALKGLKIIDISGVIPIKDIATHKQKLVNKADDIFTALNDANSNKNAKTELLQTLNISKFQSMTAEILKSHINSIPDMPPGPKAAEGGKVETFDPKNQEHYSQAFNDNPNILHANDKDNKTHILLKNTESETLSKLAHMTSCDTGSIMNCTSDPKLSPDVEDNMTQQFLKDFKCIMFDGTERLDSKAMYAAIKNNDEVFNLSEGLKVLVTSDEKQDDQQQQRAVTNFLLAIVPKNDPEYTDMLKKIVNDKNYEKLKGVLDKISTSPKINLIKNAITSIKNNASSTHYKK